MPVPAHPVIMTAKNAPHARRAGNAAMPRVSRAPRVNIGKNAVRKMQVRLQRKRAIPVHAVRMTMIIAVPVSAMISRLSCGNANRPENLFLIDFFVDSSRIAGRFVCAP